MTTSRMGIMGRRRVSDFSLEVSIAVGKHVGAGNYIAAGNHEDELCGWLGSFAPGWNPLRSEPKTQNVSGERGLQPAFSNKAILIFCVMTISLVTRNSRTFL